MSSGQLRGDLDESAPNKAWVILGIDDLRLAVSQQEVIRLDLTEDMVIAGSGDDSWDIARLTVEDGQQWFACNLSGALQPDRRVPDTRTICAFLTGEREPRGLLCDRVWSVDEDEQFDVQPVFGCMETATSPTTGLARFEEQLVVVTDAEALFRYVDNVTEQRDVKRAD